MQDEHGSGTATRHAQDRLLSYGTTSYVFDAAGYRVGSEGRIPHLERDYGAGRSRLRGTEGARIWEGWAVLVWQSPAFGRRSLYGVSFRGT